MLEREDLAGAVHLLAAALTAKVLCLPPSCHIIAPVRRFTLQMVQVKRELMVNNAGTAGEQARIDEQDADELTRLMQVNVVAPMVCARHAVQAMSTAHGGTRGSIVNIASVAARTTGGISGTVPYGATKGALVTFTRGLSDEVAPEGIRVNSVSPGAIATEMSAAVPEAQEAAVHSPLGRIGRPDEIAAAVSWLISPEASFITGSDITVSGGV